MAVASVPNSFTAYTKIQSSQVNANFAALVTYLNSAFNSSVVLKVANGGTGLASYAAGDLIYASGATTLSKLPVGSNGTFLKLVAGVPAWAGTVNSLSVVSKVADYTITSSDDVVLCSGAAFNLTLPSAASNSGKFYYLKKTDASFSNIITITRAGSDTIEGATTTTLNSLDETIILLSDGVATWQILSRTYSQASVAYTPTFTGFGTVSNVEFFYRRSNASIEIYGGWTTGTVTATEARASLPSGLTSAGSSAIGTLSPAGLLWSANTGSTNFYTFMEQSVAYVTFGRSDGGFAKQNGTGFNNSEAQKLRATVPIAGWN